MNLILNDDKVYFSNSIGDVTAVNISSGEVIWQTPTQSNVLFGSTYFLKLSDGTIFPVLCEPFLTVYFLCAKLSLATCESL